MNGSSGTSTCGHCAIDLGLHDRLDAAHSFGCANLAIYYSYAPPSVGKVPLGSGPRMVSLCHYTAALCLTVGTVAEGQSTELPVSALLLSE